MAALRTLVQKGRNPLVVAMIIKIHLIDKSIRKNHCPSVYSALRCDLKLTYNFRRKVLGNDYPLLHFCFQTTQTSIPFRSLVALHHNISFTIKHKTVTST